jgi:hypothetical protein
VQADVENLQRPMRERPTTAKRKNPQENRMNRKMNLTAALVIGSVSAFATSAFAGSSNTGNLVISGTVSAVAEVEIYDSANAEAITTYTTLNLGLGESSTQIATIHEKCNHEAGYTMTISHVNKGSGGAESWLGNAGSSKIAYTLTYDGSAVAFVAGSVIMTSTSAINPDYPSFTPKALAITIVDSVSTSTPNSGVVTKNNLSILPAGTYSDTLTFTVAAKA